MLTVRLLGQFNIQYEDTPILLPSRPAQSLLARLVLTAGMAHRREKLAGDQWPDASEANALSNLRHALWRIRGGLRRAGADPDNYITADDMVIRFKADAAYWVDALVVEHESTRAATTINDLMQTAALYRGGLLPGFYDEGNNWATPIRSRLTLAFDRLMARLIERLRDEACWPQIVDMGRRWVAHGESQEIAYRELMIAHGALGDLAGVRVDYRDCAEYLHKELGAEPSPETRALFEQLLSGAYPFAQTSARNGATPPPAAPSAIEPPPNNLPEQATPFVGRVNDLKGIAALLARPDCRLITLLGPGGVGKTRLAIRAASAALRERDMAGAFSDGVYFVRLDAATTSEGLLTALSDAVRHVPFGQEHPKTQLLNFLREKKMLLVLDNFEQLLRDDVDGASVVDEVLATAQGVKALVTSRERLHLPSEHLVEVDGLDFPDDADIAADDGDLMRFGAVQLFLQAAQRILSRFSFQAEKASVARICRLTQGMPLALELAAAWVRTLSCKEIAARIEHNLDVLAATEPNLSDRHRSVRAVLDYSWQLLSPQERNAFTALSVFRGGFELDAAEDVARTSVAMLYALVDKSLLRRSPAGRYDMHDLVRRYGEEKLDAREDEDYSPDTVHARMARYFLQFAQAHGKDYPALEPEWANFLAAMRAADKTRQPKVVLEMAAALDDAWTTQGRFSDARQGYALARDTARVMGDDGALMCILRRLGRMCIEQADYGEAEQHLNTAWEISQRLSDELEGARIQFCQALIATERANHAEAAHLLMDSSEVLQQFGDEGGAADALYTLSRLFYRRLEDDEAAKYAAQSLAQHEALGNVTGAARAHRMLALVASAKGQHEVALNHGQTAVTLLESLADQAELAEAAYDLAQVLRRANVLVKAREQLMRSYQLMLWAGVRKSQPHALSLLGQIDQDLGHYDLALAEAKQGLALYGELDDPWSSIYVRNTLGQIFVKLGRRREAAEVWATALAIAESLQHPSIAQLRSWLEELNAANSDQA